MWPTAWRDDLPHLLAQPYDVVVIGGGITGAGILLEAARRGLRTLLVEQRDFAWGTSSRSSKLVHGGLRYIKQGKLLLTRDSVRERQHLLQAAAGLVEPQPFAFGQYAGRKPNRRVFAAGLAVYDWLAGARTRRLLSADEFLMEVPHARREGLAGVLGYLDAKTDDARLVLRVLQEGQMAGGHAVNYMAARALVREGGRVCGAELEDAITKHKMHVRARVVINATGAWAERLHDGSGQKLRPLRGSHLVLPAWRLPVAQAVSLMHPTDGRPVFAFPWEGVAIVGTTDVDHRGDLQTEAAITTDELHYLLAALAFQFPDLGITRDDVIATYAGVRPVIDSGKSDPSSETREHAVWKEEGLLTVTGGKLTTFRLIALDALHHAAPMLGRALDLAPRPVFEEAAPLQALGITRGMRLRLCGRYGAHAQALVDAAQAGELELFPGTCTLWAELRWAARVEAVMHLEDLLLRRTRLGLQLRKGGAEHMARIRAVCQTELGWDDARWEREQRDYQALWERYYDVPRDDDEAGVREERARA